MSKIFQDILKRIPLETSVKVYLELSYVDFLTESGFRSDTPWSQEEDDLYNKLLNVMDQYYPMIVKELKEEEVNKTKIIVLLTTSFYTLIEEVNVFKQYRTIKENEVFDLITKMVDELYQYFIKKKQDWIKRGCP